MPRTAETIFAGDARPVELAARRAAAVVGESAGSMSVSSAKMAAAQEAAAAKTAAAHDKMVASAKKSNEEFAKWGSLAAVAVVAGAVDMASKVESAATAIAKAGNTGTDAGKKIEDAFRTIPGTVEYSAAHIGEAFATVAGELKVVAGHALTSAEAMKVMKASLDLADAAGEDLIPTTEALGKVMMTFHLGASQAAKTADVLFNASKVTGIGLSELTTLVDRARGRLGALAPSLGDTAGLMAELAKQGVAGRLTMGALGGAFGTLLSQSKTVNATLKELDVHVFDNRGRFVGLASVISQLHPVLSKYNEASQLAITKTLFGEKANKQLLEVIRQGPGAYAAATAAVTRHGTAAAAAAQEHQTLQGKLRSTKADFENIAATLGERFIPILQKVAGAISESIKWLDKHKSAAKALAVLVTTVLGAALVDFAVVKAIKFVESLKKMGSGIKVLAATFGLIPSAAEVASAKTIAAQTATTDFIVSSDGTIVAANEAAGASFTAMLGPIAAVVAALVAAQPLINKLTGGGLGENPEVDKNAGTSSPWAKKAKQQGAAGQGTLGSGNQFGFISEIASRFGISPNTLWGIYGVETTYGADINTSSTGAQGAFQFEPGTAHTYGYPLTNHPNAAQFRAQAEAAARYIASNARKYGSEARAVEAYYAGHPGGQGDYLHKVEEKGGSHYGKAQEEEAQAQVGSETFTPPTAARKAKKAREASAAQIDRWAEQSVGKFAESWGNNTGPELDKLQAEFHTHAAAWCAEFATTAAMFGGASKAVRTASVASIREWAQAGTHGYRKGVSHTPHVGDMMMFGDSHVAFVTAVHGNTVSTIEGNTGAGKVSRGTRTVGEGDFASPIYQPAGGPGGVELQQAAKAFAEAAMAYLSPKDMGRVVSATNAASAWHARATEFGGGVTAEGAWLGHAEKRWAREPVKLDTAAGAAAATTRDTQRLDIRASEKRLYERELRAMRIQVIEWEKAKAVYVKAARHLASGPAKKDALKKAAAFDAKIQQAKAAASELEGTIESQGDAIEEAQAALAALPGEQQAADLSAYDAAVGKVDAEVRAGVKSEAEGKAAKEGIARGALTGAYGPLSEEGVLKVKGDLREFSQALQEATAAQESHTQALKDATKTLAEFDAASKSLAQVESGVAVKALADIISGQIAGTGYHPGVNTPGAGMAARY